jgi:hypothetical protein
MEHIGPSVEVSSKASGVAGFCDPVAKINPATPLEMVKSFPICSSEFRGRNAPGCHPEGRLGKDGKNLAAENVIQGGMHSRASTRSLPGLPSGVARRRAVPLRRRQARMQALMTG